MSGLDAALVERMYGRSLDWFARSYDCVLAGGALPPILGATARWALEPASAESPTLLCGGPCLDHAFPRGPSGVSFQIAIETYTLLELASRQRRPLLLFVMGGDAAEGPDEARWEASYDCFRAFVGELMVALSLEPLSVQYEPTWLRSHAWAAQRAERWVDTQALLFRTMYQPGRPLGGTSDRQLSASLERAYHDNLLAYDPGFVRGLSEQRVERVIHVENLQQLRAFTAARQLLDIDGRLNAHAWFLPCPAPDGSVRMTRAQGTASLPAHLGTRALLGALREPGPLRDHLSRLAPAETIEFVAWAFTHHFAGASRG